MVSVKIHLQTVRQPIFVFATEEHLGRTGNRVLRSLRMVRAVYASAIKAKLLSSDVVNQFHELARRRVQDSAARCETTSEVPRVR